MGRISIPIYLRRLLAFGKGFLAIRQKNGFVNHHVREFHASRARERGSTSGAVADANGLPGTVSSININNNTDPSKRNVFRRQRYGAGRSKDAYTVMLHELGHALGFNYRSGGDGYQKWNDRITGTNFDMFGTQVTLAGADPNGPVPYATSYAATDLMNLSVGFGNRAMSRSLTYASGGGLRLSRSPRLSDQHPLRWLFWVLSA